MALGSLDLTPDVIADPQVSVVIPCLNEAGTLPACIEKSFELLRILQMPGEIIVVDNGSTDGSAEIARSLGANVIPSAARGYGAALLAGCRAARGRYLVVGDADDTYDFREAAPMVQALLAGSDLCMGTRLKGDIRPGAMPWKNRYIGTPALTMILNLIFHTRITDVNCGLRALTKDAFERMQLQATGMEFASEMLVKAAVLNLHIAELPVTLHKDRRGRSPHLQPWRDGWRHLKFILLFTPQVLYWLPGAAMLCIGIVLGALLVSKPGGSPLYIGGVPFNDHWIIPAGLLMAVGYQTITTGVLLYIYTLLHRVYQRSRKLEQVIHVLTIERVLVLALALIAIGIAFEASVIDAWFKVDFGPLNAIRPAVFGMTLILMGTQTIFSGFFYAVLVERYQREAETFSV